MKQLMKILILLSLLWVDVGSLYGQDCGFGGAHFDSGSSRLNHFINTIDAVPIVVEGKVVDRRGFLHNGEIYTAQKLLIFKVLKGDIEQDTIEIIHQGGSYDYPDGSSKYVSMLFDLGSVSFGLNTTALFKLTKDFESGRVSETIFSELMVQEENSYFVDYLNIHPCSFIYEGLVLTKENHSVSHCGLDTKKDFVDKVYAPIEKKTGKKYREFHEMKMDWPRASKKKQ